jgi:F0F1-type ATP synthase membrane subunit b/b'
MMMLANGSGDTSVVEEAGQYLASAKAVSAQILSNARAEAAALITEAIAAIDEHTAYAVRASAEAEQCLLEAREMAAKMIAQTESEMNRRAISARMVAQAEFDMVRETMAMKAETLRHAMDRTETSIDRAIQVIDTPPELDLRTELTTFAPVPVTSLP